MQNAFFPYENVREEQGKLIVDVMDAVSSGKNLIAHAPTGLGKTIAALGPCLKVAVEKKKTVFFLTSRHTQHMLAIRTLRDIKEKFGLKIICCDLIGKKWMCSQNGVEDMNSREFNEYCKSLRNDNLCDFYTKTKDNGKPSFEAKSAMEELIQLMPADTEKINEVCRLKKICPYETASMIGKDSDVVIADYSYIFNEKIRESFFRRAGKKIEDAILIIDEGHNLPERCREMMSERLSTYVLERAILEALDSGNEQLHKSLLGMKKCLEKLAPESDEDFILKGEFMKGIENYDDLANALGVAAEKVREIKRTSFMGSVSSFMEAWKGEDYGFCRTITKNEHSLILQYKCLDPSIITKPVISNAFSTIMMSGTLTPGEMYSDLLGFKDCKIKEYNDPFSQRNRLCLVIDEVTTKYTARGNEQYRKIALLLSKIVNNVPGNSIAFFPSYELRNNVHRYFEPLCRKTIFTEMPGLSKEEKKALLEKFKKYKDTGAIMLGVAKGSFGEGIDLPGELLKCVIVVGVPLSKPDLETKELISYYQERFGEGMNYGYFYPAITRTMQNAGRCIRTETDRGVIVFMDSRYAWENYAKCFPKEWGMRVNMNWESEIKGFFKQG